MSRLVAGVAVLLVTLGASAAWASDADVMRAFDLLGTWAIDCSAPSAPRNPYTTFADTGTGVTRTLEMGLPDLDGTYGVRAAVQVDHQHIALELDDATHVFKKVVIVKFGDGWYTERAEDADGSALIRDGRFAGNDAPVPRFRRCSGP
ncbi:MAG TPA: hypothetical protein VKX28_26525 [Xanthobacteraceae bacterium]|jgi:hypothetical protein|nr:hypothetical protein [Xanthobacteraceae bacterium]